MPGGRAAPCPGTVPRGGVRLGCPGGGAAVIVIVVGESAAGAVAEVTLHGVEHPRLIIHRHDDWVPHKIPMQPHSGHPEKDRGRVAGASREALQALAGVVMINRC